MTLLDSTSLLVAAAISAMAIMTTLLLSWLGSRQDRYLLSWFFGLGLILPSIFAFTVLGDPWVPAVQFVAYSALMGGFALIYSGAMQFRKGRTSPIRLVSIWLLGTASVGISFSLGLTGLGVVFLNLFTALLLILAGREHWEARAEAMIPMVTMAILYGLTAVTFVLCAVVLLSDGTWVINHHPDNWAEDLNSLATIVSLASVGALALTVNQMRTSRQHQRDAMTDALTGLHNRRALFDMAAGHGFERGTSVIMFDLDRFKHINDRFGHARGDEVLRDFATYLRRGVNPGDIAARLGGEEFCLVLNADSSRPALEVADRIRVGFARSMPLSPEFGSPTVSAGVATSQTGDEGFEMLLREADEALYLAKNNGRDRVQGAPPRLVSDNEAPQPRRTATRYLRKRNDSVA
ncbi:diguanylate cyclase [Devosia sp.]|uniref:GGDEF domain-containing protein n=1 Tax=Devosia sp. TaxID=1871048 RepID=UPI003A8ED7C3